RLSRTSRRTQRETSKFQPCLDDRSKTSREAPVREMLAAMATLLSTKILKCLGGIDHRPLHPRRSSMPVPPGRKSVAEALRGLCEAAWPEIGEAPPFLPRKASPRLVRLPEACSCCTTTAGNQQGSS